MWTLIRCALESCLNLKKRSGAVLLCRGMCTVQEKQYHAWLERSREAPARGLPFKPTMFTIQPGSAIDAQRLLVRGLAHTTQLATLFDPRLPREVGVTACTRMQP